MTRQILRNIYGLHPIVRSGSSNYRLPQTLWVVRLLNDMSKPAGAGGSPWQPRWQSQPIPEG